MTSRSQAEQIEAPEVQRADAQEKRRFAFNGRAFHLSAQDRYALESVLARFYADEEEAEPALRLVDSE